MKILNRILRFVLITFLFYQICFARTLPLYAPGGLIIKFTTKINNNKQFRFHNEKDTLFTNIKEIDTLNRKFHAKSYEAFYDTLYNPKKDISQGKDRLYVLQFQHDLDMEMVANEFKKATDYVEEAFPNYLFEIDLVPDDTKYDSDQWSLPRISCEEAWEITTGSQNVTIGIMDTGIDLDHPELQSKLTVTKKDFVNINILAYTSNGYSLDLLEDYIIKDNVPRDRHGHGTFVAGVVGALSNNNEGIASVAWNCKIMPLRVGFRIYDDIYNQWRGLVEMDDWAEALEWAANSDEVDIINMSFGFTEDEDNNNFNYSFVEEAYNAGILLIAASGNDNTTTKQYPAGHDEFVIAVGATNQSDERCDYYDWWNGQGSNYGEWLDVTAPGNDIYSTSYNDTYQTGNGTSYAAPHVAGLAGLILSHNPNLTNTQIWKRIINGAEQVGGYNYDKTTGKSLQLGHGRINAYNSLKYFFVPTVEYPTITSALNDAIAGQVIVVNDAISLESDLILTNEQSIIIEANAKVDMKTYKILAGSGSLSVESDATLYPNIRLVNITTPYGYYPSLSSVFTAANAGYGNKIYVSDTLNLSTAEFIPTGKDFRIETDTYVQLASNASIAGSMIITSGATLNPDIRRSSVTGVTGIYSDINSALASSYTVYVDDICTSSDHVTVGSNETLIPRSGSELKFASGKYLGVLNGGNLTANGATFTGNSATWNGIKYYSGSTGSLTNCIISDALYGVRLNSSRTVDNCTITTGGSYNYGVYVNSANPIIKNSDITGSDFSTTTNTSYGVYCYNSSPDITNNVITADYGIYCYNSSPDIKKNEVINSITGLYCESSSSPLLVWQEANVDGDNYFHSDETEFGVYAIGSSNPIIGTVSCGQELFGRNSFDYNDFDIAIVHNGTSNLTIKAEHCWWGSSPPSSGLFSGSVDYDPWLTSIPTYSSQSPSPENNLYDTRMMLSSVMPEEEALEDLTRYYNDQWGLEKKIDFIRYLYIIGETHGVADLCKDIIFENPYAREAFAALDMIYQISKNEKIKKDFDKDLMRTYLKTLEDSRSNEYLEANAMLLLAGLEKDVKRMDKVYKEHKDTYIGKFALHQQFMYYFHEEEDMELSRGTLNLMDEVYPDEVVTYEAHALMGDEVVDPREFYSQYHKKDATEQVQLISTDIAEILPEEYALSAAYPNPFNPQTTLEYALPMQSKVECSIYSISGELVKSFNFSQNAGTYSIVWDGSDVSSGIYLIRFVAEASDGSEAFIDYQKVTLLK